MTRFENIEIGQTFGLAQGTSIVLLQKKSLSSAYTLDASTQERTSVFGFEPILKFAPGVVVYQIK